MEPESYDVAAWRGTHHWDPATEGRVRAAEQLAYARTLLVAVKEAAQEVVDNLVQIENEQEPAKKEVPEQAVPLNRAESQQRKCTAE